MERVEYELFDNGTVKAKKSDSSGVLKKSCDRAEADGKKE